WYRPERDICLDPPSNIYCPYWPTFADMWFFNYKTRKCELFLYNGCTTDQNVFATCLECKEACQRHMVVLQSMSGRKLHLQFEMSHCRYHRMRHKNRSLFRVEK
ncbi:hypothetical protein MTO96_046119, partial [Rhipicephalus appendiculatus]